MLDTPKFRLNSKEKKKKKTKKRQDKANFNEIQTATSLGEPETYLRLFFTQIFRFNVSFCFHRDQNLTI